MKHRPASYLFVASMDIDAAHEDLFHEVYQAEHIPNLLRVPGVTAVDRFVSLPFSVRIGGEKRQIDPSPPAFHALYEIDDPSVLVSEAWAGAIDAGRWPGEIRPFTYNRRHSLLKRIGETSAARR